jgi:hypothetical protein
MLCAVAVMHVEIDDCDALCAVRLLRMARRDGGVVQEAEAHRQPSFRMMAGRTSRHEGVCRPAGHDRVDGEKRSPRRPQSRLERSWRHRHVLVNGRVTVGRRAGVKRLDIFGRVHATDRHFISARRGISHQRPERLVFERALDSAQTIGPFGMVLPHFVGEASRMCNEQRRHRFISQLEDVAALSSCLPS